MNATSLRPGAESAYLRHLSGGLHGLSQPDRAAIVAEIEGHIAERVAEGADLATVLDRLGPPDVLAQNYLEQRELSRVLAKGSPGPMLASILGRATRNIAAMVCGVIAAIFYFLCFGFIAIAVMKSVMGPKLHFWVNSKTFCLCTAGPQSFYTHEILGYWLIPISLVAAVLCYVAGTEVLKFCGRLLLKRSSRV
jgi:uncharacterized membrane protein